MNHSAQTEKVAEIVNRIQLAYTVLELLRNNQKVDKKTINEAFNDLLETINLIKSLYP